MLQLVTLLAQRLLWIVMEQTKSWFSRMTSRVKTSRRSFYSLTSFGRFIARAGRTSIVDLLAVVILNHGANKALSFWLEAWMGCNCFFLMTGLA